MVKKLLLAIMSLFVLNVLQAQLTVVPPSGIEEIFPTGVLWDVYYPEASSAYNYTNVTGNDLDESDLYIYLHVSANYVVGRNYISWKRKIVGTDMLINQGTFEVSPNWQSVNVAMIKDSYNDVYGVVSYIDEFGIPYYSLYRWTNMGISSIASHTVRLSNESITYEKTTSFIPVVITVDRRVASIKMDAHGLNKLAFAMVYEKYYDNVRTPILDSSPPLFIYLPYLWGGFIGVKTVEATSGAPFTMTTSPLCKVSNSIGYEGTYIDDPDDYVADNWKSGVSADIAIAHNGTKVRVPMLRGEGWDTTAHNLFMYSESFAAISAGIPGGIGFTNPFEYNKNDEFFSPDFSSFESAHGGKSGIYGIFDHLRLDCPDNAPNDYWSLIFFFNNELWNAAGNGFTTDEEGVVPNTSGPNHYSPQVAYEYGSNTYIIAFHTGGQYDALRYSNTGVLFSPLFYQINFPPYMPRSAWNHIALSRNNTGSNGMFMVYPDHGPDGFGQHIRSKVVPPLASSFVEKVPLLSNLDKSIQMYPNPFTDVIQLKSGHLDQLHSVVISNIEGKILHIMSNRNVSDINDQLKQIAPTLVNGMYHIQVTTEGKQQTFSIVK